MAELPNDDEYSWLIVPLLLGAVFVVTLVGGVLLERLPRSWAHPIPPQMVFVGGTVLATIVAVAVIMAVSITWLGCCD